MNNDNASLFSGRVSTGRTTWFVDVRQAVNDRFYISLTESRRISDSGFEQNRVFLFEDSLEEIEALLAEASGELKKAASERGELKQEGSSGKYERSGKAWTEEEESILQEEFRNGTPRDSIASRLKRSTYAITLRLEKIGLIEKEEKEAV